MISFWTAGIGFATNSSQSKLDKLNDKIDDAEKELAAGKKKLADEKSKYQAKIRDGWNMYYTQKADLELKLEEAKALLAENREEAEAKIAQIRADYFEKLKKILPAKKIYKLYEAEEEYKKLLINGMSRCRQQTKK